MFCVILFEPEIPPNTGNIIRLCANTGCELHLVKPMGFPLEDTKLRRAGLDYHEYTHLIVHENWRACLNTLSGRRIFAVSTKGAKHYNSILYQARDVFLFGPETRGLPQSVLTDCAITARIRLPMLPHSRSLNLSNAVAVTVFEAWRQLGFDGGY